MGNKGSIAKQTTCLVLKKQLHHSSTRTMSEVSIRKDLTETTGDAVIKSGC